MTQNSCLSYKVKWKSVSLLHYLLNSQKKAKFPSWGNLPIYHIGRQLYYVNFNFLLILHYFQAKFFHYKKKPFATFKINLYRGKHLKTESFIFCLMENSVFFIFCLSYSKCLQTNIFLYIY